MKRNNKYTWFLILFIVIIDGCIDRYEIPDKIVIPRLVVDGLITNRPGPYQVRLFTAYDVNTFVNKPNPVQKATVKISDDAGTSEVLTEITPGVYETSSNGIQGVVGRSYQLQIKTQTGEYMTNPQVLYDGGQLLDLRYQFEENAISSSAEPFPAVRFYVDSKGTPQQQNYFRWRWSSIYETQNNPELKTKEVGKPPKPVPNPPECSGYKPASGGIVRFDVCTCCNCWTEETGKTALVSKNSSVSEDEFSNVLVATVPMDDRKFDIRFYFKIDQLSISEEVYNYWKLVEAQQVGEGSLFQPNAVQIQGNVYSTTNPDETVLGIFSVSGIVTRDVFIDRKEVPFVIEVETVPESCLLRPGSTNVKPLFW